MGYTLKSQQARASKLGLWVGKGAGSLNVRKDDGDAFRYVAGRSDRNGDWQAHIGFDSLAEVAEYLEAKESMAEQRHYC